MKTRNHDHGVADREMIEYRIQQEKDMGLIPSSNLPRGENDAACHQRDAARWQDSGYFWAMPESYLGGRVRGTNKADKAYIAACGKFWRHWKISSVDCVPPRLRKSTPYSMALVARLAAYAGWTRGKLAAAHDALVSAYSRRRETERSQLHVAERGDAELVTTVPRTIKDQPNRMDVEAEIVESRAGLMLIDVHEAGLLVRRVNTMNRFNASTFEEAAEKRAAQIKAKSARREARRKGHGWVIPANANATAQPDAEIDRAITVATQSIAAGLPESNQPLRLGADSESAMDTMADQEPSLRIRFKHWEHEVDRLGKDVNGFKMSSGNHRLERQMKKKKHQTKMEKRQNGATASLPSERLQIGQMPSLHAKAKDTEEQQQLASRMHSMSLAQQKPLPAFES